MNKLKFGLIFSIGFVVYYFADATFFSILQQEITSFTKVKALGHILAYSVTLVPLLITVSLLHKDYKNIFENLGLSNNLIVGLAFGFICTVPMLIGFYLKFSITKNVSLDTIIINTISSAFFEEIIYRAFLFGTIYRLTKSGFLPSVFLGSLLFGLAHLYQSSDSEELAGIFAITFLGSLLFGWLYCEWNFNLWTAIFLHTFMNLFWLIFDVDNNALGGTYANIFRLLTVLIAVFGTIVYKRKMNLPFEIKGRKWLMK